MGFSLLILLLCCAAVVDCQLSLTESEDCKANESFQTCGTACEPSCDNLNPSFCTLQCVVGCQCDKGFVRDANRNCVLPHLCTINNETSNSSNTTSSAENPCNLIDCRAGTTCSMKNGEPLCTPELRESLITCANIRCGSRGGCVMVEPAGCTGNCELQPHCVEVNACDSKICNSTEICVHVQVVCVRAPCDPVAQCRSKTEKGAMSDHEKRETRFASISEPSCMTARCGTPAGCAMVRPSHCSSETCLLKPMCLHENACASTSCLIGSECVLQEVVCITEPCNPIAKCELLIHSSSKDCQDNERFSECKTKCSEKTCNREPEKCSQKCSSSGCVCKEGFLRNSRGKCVTENDCVDEKETNPAYP